MAAVSTLDDNNEIFKIAVDLVNQTSRNIFLTGKAGTGKTTFLRYIKEHSAKQAAVVAPTGVAAINAGGSTIHSFFQLPFSPFLPEAKRTTDQTDANNKHSLLGKIKLNRDRIKVIRQLELLIIDEISMVRCDLIDAIDTVLRHFRHRHTEAFGGVQVLLIGDMYQLPPVTVPNEWNLLSQFYLSPYFFDSRVIQQFPPVFLEFTRIYRQRDDRFIDLLNQVRNNSLSQQGKQVLENLYKPDIVSGKTSDHIILTTHNAKADAVNFEELGRLASQSHIFKASIEGDFNEKAYPAEESLILKEGAKVMFIKNDKEKVKRYYNGKIGTITRINHEAIFVQCQDEPEEIEVQKETWENIRYMVNRSSNQLEEEVVGSFTQYPLRLAWAITIHKSQGLTFEKAVIDAGDAFAAGQVYVALSRCTSLDGIILQSRITSAGLRTDETIARFSKNLENTGQLNEELQNAKKNYQEDVLVSTFDLSSLSRSCRELEKQLEDNKKDFNDAAFSWIGQVHERISYLQGISEKFKLHLKHFFAAPVLPEENPGLQERTKNAAGYFKNELNDVLNLVASSPVITESKVQARNFNDAMKELFVAIAEKKHITGGFTEGFSIEKYYQQKKSFIIPSLSVNSYATTAEEKTETLHPKLHFRLRELRNKICEEKNAPIYMVANGKTIDEMVMYLPQTKEDLVKISGFGKTKVAQYGDRFLDLIVQYCIENHLVSLIQEKTPKKEQKPKEAAIKRPDTKTTTYELFKAGRSVQEIAAERKLTTQTIENHLAFYVSKGMIAVQELVEREKLVLIEPYISDTTGSGLISIKEKLGNAVSYGEIRLAIAAKEWEKVQNS